jgi:hypothetical protein
MEIRSMSHAADWPALPLDDWEPTYLTVHRFTQVLGKLCIAFAPPQNHWWHTALHVTTRGLATAALPDGARTFELALDFCAHRLLVHSSDGRETGFALRPMPVAEFLASTLECLAQVGVHPVLNPVPSEVSDRTPLDEDRHHAAYDPDAVSRLHRILVQVDRVFRIHRGRFIGKSSPVHFFWGAFDLAVTRFCGRVNPEPPADPVMAQAYSHEVISHGFWPGGDWPGAVRVPEAIFYSYVVPAADGLANARIEPASARFDPGLGEFVLPYDDVRTSADPQATLLAFMESTYRAASTLRRWDVTQLELPSPLTASPASS